MDPEKSYSDGSCEEKCYFAYLRKYNSSREEKFDSRSGAASHPSQREHKDDFDEIRLAPRDTLRNLEEESDSLPRDVSPHAPTTNSSPCNDQAKRNVLTRVFRFLRKQKKK
mmetsp:Transcript_15141/g.28945  ORF Transcript_15141/g.28945 Transcript_15141/m.28945 type:complete len:111 (+) Transcript_15141:756-1088(+)